MSSWLFLSPHLDDAVLSCGGLIAKLSTAAKVTIATAFCSAPWFGPYSNLAGWLHGIAGVKNARCLARIRRYEDAAACRRVGAGYVHWYYRDAVYRVSSPGHFLYPSIIQTDPVPQDASMISRLAKQIDRLADGHDFLVAPLGIGRHVDHLVVRQAAERCERMLLYYPDIPYLWFDPAGVSEYVNGLSIIKYHVEQAFVDCWVAAVLDYRSQWNMLNDAAKPLDQRLREYAASQLTLFANDGLQVDRIWQSDALKKQLGLS